MNEIEKCVAGCQVYTGGETKHHKDCPYYPESMSRLFDELKEEVTDIKTRLGGFIEYLGDAEKEKEKLKARLKGIEERASEENIEKVYNDMKDKQYPCLFKVSDYSKVLSADILRKGE